MKIKNILSIALMASSLGLFSCQETSTNEKEIIDQQNELQKIALSVQIVSANTGKSLAGATGVASVDGLSVSSTTDDNGFVHFKGLRPGNTGTTNLRVVAANYTTANVVIRLSQGSNGTSSSSSSASSGSKVGQVSAKIPLFTSEEQFATVTGKATYEQDLTNETPENVPDGTVVSANIQTSSDEYQKFLQQYQGTDAGAIVSVSYESDFWQTQVSGGEYTLKVPAFANGIPVKIEFADIKTNQKIAANALQGESHFPYVLPSIKEIETVYTSTSATAESIPDVASIYVNVNTQIAGNNDTDIDARYSRTVNSYEVARPFTSVGDLGRIFKDVTTNFTSNGSGYTGTKETVSIVSLIGGSGVTAESDVVSGRLVSFKTTAQGSGYPKRANANYNTPRDFSIKIIGAPSSNSEPANEIKVRPGLLYVRNVDYGTGSYRNVAIR